LKIGTQLFNFELLCLYRDVAGLLLERLKMKSEHIHALRQYRHVAKGLLLCDPIWLIDDGGEVSATTIENMMHFAEVPAPHGVAPRYAIETRECTAHADCTVYRLVEYAHGKVRLIEEYSNLAAAEADRDALLIADILESLENQFGVLYSQEDADEWMSEEGIK
jgi:hypothetical protein